MVAAGRRQGHREDREREAGEEAGAGVMREAGGPVSYTHLRAHETVLDRVCRILLEKQKKLTADHEITEHQTIRRRQTTETHH